MEKNKNNCVVLIVDDDNDLCRILEFVITNKCSVHSEHTIRDAENYLSCRKPDIIFLDNSLPDGSGIKSIKNIHSLYPDVKIVLMTSDTTEGLQEKAIRDGAVKFIGKPFKAAVINELIMTLCPELRAA